MSNWSTLASAVAKTSKARNGYMHVPKKKKEEKEEKKVVLYRKGVKIS